MRRRLSPPQMLNTAVTRPSFEQDQRSIVDEDLGNIGRSMSSDTVVAMSTNNNNSNEDNKNSANSNSSSNDGSGPVKQQQLTDSDKSTIVGTPTSITNASPFGDDNNIDLIHPSTTTPQSTIRKRINDGNDENGDNEGNKKSNPITVVDVIEASNSIAIMGSIRRSPSSRTKKDQQQQRQQQQHYYEEQQDNKQEEEQKIKRRHKNDVFVDVHNDAITSSHHQDDALEQLFQTKKSILLLLGQCLLKYGSPCHRVEDTLRHTARMLAIDATFSIVPDLVLVSITKPPDSFDNSSSNGSGIVVEEHEQRQQGPKRSYEPETLTIKSAQNFDTGKLVRVTKTMNSLHRGDLNLDSCLASLHEIIEAPATCGPLEICFSFAAIGFSATLCMFEGSLFDALLAAALGLMVALLFLISISFPVYGPVFEISACIMVGIFDRVLHDYVCFSKVAVSSILILLPGYGMTMAVMEISAHQVTTGAIRLIYAVIYAFMLAYGLQIGSSVYMVINPDIQDEGTCNGPISPWFYIILFPIMAISIGLAYGSSKYQWLTQIACAGIGFCVLYFLGQIISDAQILSTIAAFAMGLYANFALKLTGDPPLAPLCVGITLLVPGSIGVRDAFSLLHQNELAQGLYPIHMLRISLGISVGLYGSAMIVYPTGKLRSLYISL